MIIKPRNKKLNDLLKSKKNGPHKDKRIHKERREVNELIRNTTIESVKKDSLPDQEPTDLNHLPKSILL